MPERERRHARILLLADTSTPEGALQDALIAAQVQVCLLNVQQVRRRFTLGGMEAAVFRKEQAHRKERALDGRAEAFLVATTCSAPYIRQGTCRFFMLFAPLLSWRHVQVTERRTAKDFAQVVKDLVEVHFPDADKIVLVMDNLNTHTPASLYEAFAPAEAKRLADKLEIHYTPKHGSWLDMAEIELSVLARQCLDRHIPDVGTLTSEVAAWEQAHNAAKRTVNWHFTTADARVKLKKLYPTTLP